MSDPLNTTVTFLEPHQFGFYDFPGAVRYAGGFMPLDTASVPTAVAVELVLAGKAKSPDLTRVRFVAPATVTAPGRFAGIYAPSDTVLVFPADVAAQLVAAGEAVTAG